MHKELYIRFNMGGVWASVRNMYKIISKFCTHIRGLKVSKMCTISSYGQQTGQHVEPWEDYNITLRHIFILCCMACYSMDDLMQLKKIHFHCILYAMLAVTSPKLLKKAVSSHIKLIATHTHAQCAIGQDTYKMASMLRNIPMEVTKKQKPDHQYRVAAYSCLDRVPLNRPTRDIMQCRAANRAPGKDKKNKCKIKYGCQNKHT